LIRMRFAIIVFLLSFSSVLSFNFCLTDRYVLNGTKMWITNGVINGETGDAFLVYAKTSPKDISFFLVEKVSFFVSSFVRLFVCSFVCLFVCLG
jgi:hypothetical protein